MKQPYAIGEEIAKFIGLPTENLKSFVLRASCDEVSVEAVYYVTDTTFFIPKFKVVPYDIEAPVDDRDRDVVVMQPDMRLLPERDSQAG